MTTIVLTVLGIMLAAAAALMIVYYGGELSDDGRVGARANGYMNAGAGIAAAVDQYRIDSRTDPASIDALVEEGYLKPDGAPGRLALAGGRVTIDGAEPEVCERINATLGRNAADAASGTGASGCGSGVYWIVVGGDSSSPSLPTGPSGPLPVMM